MTHSATPSSPSGSARSSCSVTRTRLARSKPTRRAS
jgi:hypothetical protein